MARVAWLAVTIVYHLLGVEQRRRRERLQHQSQKLDSTGQHQGGLVLSCLRSRLQPIGWPCGSYIPALFAYLQYPYNPGLTRAALTLLKWLTQFSEVDLFACLDHHSRLSVRTACLSTLTCPEEDRQQRELTRAALFDLLTEVVLCHRRLPTQRDNLPPLLRLLLSQSGEQEQRQSQSVSLVGGLLPIVEAAAGQKLSVQPDCFECCLAVLRQAKQWFKEEECLDSVRLTLLCNVVKLVAAVFLQDIKVGINALKSNSSFWELLVSPIRSLIDRKAGKGVRTEMSNVENELCGHIASVLGLELFSLLYVYNAKRPPPSFGRVLDEIGSANTYPSWFKLVSRSLKETCAGVKAHPSVGEDLRTMTSRVTGLYEATCRWKCLLLLHLRHLDREADPEVIGGRLADEAFPFSALVDSLIDALSALIQFPLLPVARDLGNQLATCLTVALLRMPSSRETGHLSRLVRLLCCLQDLAPGAAIPTSEIAGLQHMHADLLACCTFCYRREQSPVVTPSADTVSTTIAAGVDMSADVTQQQQEQLLDSALFYLRQAVDALIEAHGAPAPAVVAIAKQSIGLLLTLCESTVASHWLCCLLAQSGVLNNLLIVLQVHSKTKNGATLCHSIFSLLLHLVTRSNSQQTTRAFSPPPSPSSRRPAEMTEVDDLELEPVLEEKKTSGVVESSTQVIASYSDLLVQAMQWPSVDTLMRWIQEDGSLMSSTEPGAWSQLLRTQLYLLLVLHDNLGGLGHPRVDQLVHGFWSMNSTQLESLLERWWLCCYQRLAATPPLVLPPTCLLVSEGFLPASRFSLAECVAALLWRLSASQSLGSTLASAGGGGVKPVAFGLLFRGEVLGKTLAFHPTCGPCYSPQMQLVIFQLALRQIAWCGILIQRPGFKSSVAGTAVVAAAAAGTPTQKSIIRSQTAPISSLNTMDNSTGLKSKSLQVVHSELGLLPLVRHLITALGIVACHLPMLGELSLLTTEELRQIHCPVQLVFSTPGLEDPSSALTFGGLLSLTDSLGNLSNRVTAHHKSNPTGSQWLTDRRRQLCSLLTRAREMTLGIILSQATSVLASEQTSTADKHLLVRELSSELKSCLSLPRSGARRSASLRSSRSPSSGRSSSVTTQQRRSPTPLLQTSGVHSAVGTGGGGAAPIGTPGDCEASILRIPLACPTGHSPFGFLQAVDRFTELLRAAL